MTDPRMFDPQARFERHQQRADRIARYAGPVAVGFILALMFYFGVTQ